MFPLYCIPTTRCHVKATVVEKNTFPRLSVEPDTISLEVSAFMSIKCRGNNKFHFGLHVKCPVFEFIEARASAQFYQRVLDIFQQR
jgi:hypothetical protein